MDTINSVFTNVAGKAAFVNHLLFSQQKRITSIYQDKSKGRGHTMADTSRETERQELHEPDKSAQDKGDTPVDQRIEEEAKDVVQEAKQDVAAARLPWYRRVKRGYIFLAVYAV